MVIKILGPAAAVALAAALSGCSAGFCIGDCSKELSTSNAERILKGEVAQQINSEIASVSCPKHVAVRAHAKFTCTVHGADGTSAPITVTQKDNKGNVSFDAPTLLHTGHAAALIASRLTRAFRTSVSVRCPDLISVHPGSQFTCRASDSKGNTRIVDVTVTDATGRIHYRLR